MSAEKPGHKLTIVERWRSVSGRRQGFIGQCECGYSGDARSDFEAAQQDAHAHLDAVPTLDATFFKTAGFSAAQSAALALAFAEVNR